VLYAASEWPLVAKGGTYLWMFHGLNRFSDDLDFTAIGDVREELAEDVASVLGLFGVRSEVKVLKDDRYTLSFRVGARGPLYRSEKDTCYVRVEVNRMERPALKEVPVKLDEPHYGIPMVYLRGMDLREVLAEKIRAMMVRGSARDLYDVWFLLVRKGVALDLRLVAEKLAFYGVEFSAAELRRRLEGMGDYWAKELRPVVFGALPGFEEVTRDITSRLLPPPEKGK